MSKNHFVVDVCPPLASLHDLNSKNGTFVNGTCYGSRRASAQESGADQPSSVLLQDGDLIVVGDTRLSVAIYQQAEVASEETKLHSGSEAKPSAVKSGLLLLPEFEIIRLLKGSAGPAKAFLAHDRQTGRKVILKVILPELALDRKARQRFERESHLARNLKHKNVVGFLDGGYSRGTIYLVLEFVDGLSLEALWRRRGKRLSWELATLLVLQILDGLAFLHDRGVIHRDLKPKNILLQKRLRKPVRPKITDLGMARLYRSAGLTDMTSPGALGGSPFFWPREQITEFRDLTPSADIYSLGTIFFRLLTGRFARPSLNDLSEDASFHSICEGIMRGGPEPISGIEGLPPVVAEVIDRSLSEDPRDRYPDAGAMRAALADGLDGQIRRNSSGSAR